MPTGPEGEKRPPDVIGTGIKKDEDRRQARHEARFDVKRRT
jgi:hypothetical protein